jgi:hypothetical protein
VQLSPWYLYFPYEAHFQAPSPVCSFPNWQAPAAGLPAGVDMAPPTTGPMLPPVTQPLGYVQPASYAYPQQVPSYWYGPR